MGKPDRLLTLFKVASENHLVSLKSIGFEIEFPMATWKR